MNEPEQYQPTNTDERQETADAAPVSSSSDAAASSQPEYGQINQPEYGAMSSQLPAGYDPYVYGAPEPEPQPADAVQQQNMQYQTGQYPSNGQQPMPPYNAIIPTSITILLTSEKSFQRSCFIRTPPSFSFPVLHPCPEN